MQSYRANGCTKLGRDAAENLMSFVGHGCGGNDSVTVQLSPWRRRFICGTSTSRRTGSIRRRWIKRRQSQYNRGIAADDDRSSCLLLLLLLQTLHALIRLVGVSSISLDAAGDIIVAELASVSFSQSPGTTGKRSQVVLSFCRKTSTKGTIDPEGAHLLTTILLILLSYYYTCLLYMLTVSPACA